MPNEIWIPVHKQGQTAKNLRVSNDFPKGETDS